ncbi:MAG: O-antigen ligase family protein [Candidatus Electrothrix communis]|nr:MAG: O-antigen ligase family protein [Candidatus Electrothrix communis]
MSIVLLKPGRVVSIISRDKIYFMFVLYIIFSILWSKNKPSSITASAVIFFSYIFSCSIVLQYKYIEAAKIINFGLLIGIILSLLVVYFKPAMGLMLDGSTSGAGWNGIYIHKNQLGRCASTSLICLFFLFFHKRRIVYIVGAGGALVCLYFSLSGTMLLSTFFAILVMSINHFFRFGKKIYFTLITILYVISAFLYFFSSRFSVAIEVVLKFLGRNIERNTFMIRQYLWDYLYFQGMKDPLAGAGIDAFWPDEGLFLRVLNDENNMWNASQSHNGFIELWLQLGIIGFIIFSLINFKAMIKLYARYDEIPFGLKNLYLGLCANYYLMNTTYSTLIGQTFLPWLIFSIFYFYVISWRSMNHGTY